MGVQVAKMDFTGEALTISSREIAELVEKRHDNVKRTIETLVERGVMVRPQFEDEQDADAMGRKRTISVYRLEKRETYIVVAQLSPEFTARLVDRWQELEDQLENQFALPDFTNPAEAARAWADQVELGQKQAAQIADMRQDVEAHERLTKADGSLSITEAAKGLGVRPKDLFSWLSSNGWIYKRAGGANWLGYQSKTNTGHLEHKSTTVLRADGSEKITEQVRVTAKGLSRLAKLIPGVAREA